MGRSELTAFGGCCHEGAAAWPPGTLRALDGLLQPVHRHKAGVKRGPDRCMGRFRGGLTTKIHAAANAAKFLAMIGIATVGIWLRAYESTIWKKLPLIA